MTSTEIPKPGNIVAFIEGANVLEGICNGEPCRFDQSDPDRVTHVPVHVRDGDKNYYVALENIVLADAVEMETR